MYRTERIASNNSDFLSNLDLDSCDLFPKLKIKLKVKKISHDRGGSSVIVNDVEHIC